MDGIGAIFFILLVAWGVWGCYISFQRGARQADAREAYEEMLRRQREGK
jgi:hypothetical protein